MWISELRVKGYKAFEDTGILHFKPGLNLIVGQNNSGKSSLISALNHGFYGGKHKNEKIYREYELAVPTMTLQLNFNGSDIKRAILSNIGTVYSVQLNSNTANWATYPNLIEGLSSINTQLMRSLGTGFTICSDHFLPDAGPESPFYCNLSGSAGELVATGLSTSPSTPFQTVFDHAWTSDTFHFSAQRYSIGSYGFARAERLDSNAANLPAVLAALQGDRGDLFRRLVDHLSEIFENIGNLSVAIVGGGFQVRTWPTLKMTDPELGFSLDDSGTGVSQVIAILYIAMTMKQSIIVVDEISSFLHPAAAKSLIRILQTNYSDHQYIITTHSPEVLSSEVVSTLKLVRRSGYDSHVKEIDVREVSNLRDVCSNLGITMSDVFAADRIIWVEGQTEEIVFPFIYSETSGAIPKGVVVTSVVATGDFNARKRRDRELAFSVYERLTEASSPLVHETIFSFDREGLSVADQVHIMQLSKRPIMFLPRRNLEAFLLDPDAVAAVINHHLISVEADLVSATAVSSWMQNNGGDKKYSDYKEWKNDFTDLNWLEKVDAAKFLHDAFLSISEGRVEYSKVKDGLSLVKYLLKENREFLHPLVDYVSALYQTIARA